MSASAEMPKFKCHKKVWALKIKEILSTIPTPSMPSPLPGEVGIESGEGPIEYTLVFEPNSKGVTFSPRLISGDYFFRHKPKPGGYFVVYKDGYESFSPASEFEDGYSLINSGEYSQYQPITAKPNAIEAAVLQCMEVRWDGDVESKRDRSNAAAQGWIAQHNGFNVITPEGIKMLLERGLIQP